MFFKTKEACKYLSVSAPTLRKLVLDGKIPFYRVRDDGAKRYLKDDLDEYMKHERVIYKNVSEIS